MPDQSKGIRTVVVNRRADKLTKGVILGCAGGALCMNVQYVVSQWEVFAPYPAILILFILSVVFTGINILADGVVTFLVFIASMQTILFWIKEAWYELITYNVRNSVHQSLILIQ